MTHKPENEITLKKPGCVAAAAAIIGAKWNAQLLFALSKGPRRFSDLEREVIGITPRTLSARLETFHQQEIICCPLDKSAWYELTAKGRDLLPVIDRMVAWGSLHGPPQNDALKQGAKEQ